MFKNIKIIIKPVPARACPLIKSGAQELEVNHNHFTKDLIVIHKIIINH
ncbi:MAG: hypothetical protein AB1567_02110 [bacterium]